MAALIASGFEILNSYPCLGEDDSKEEEMKAGWPQQNVRYMCCNWIVVALFQTVWSTCSQSNYSRISVEESHADNCVFGSYVLVVHDNEHFVDIYGFNKMAGHFNASTVDAATVYNDPIMHSTVGYQD